MIDIVDITKCT